ncbi:myosin light chain kinase A-like [Sycon ciliatum]|uniref:myosin light chain kinase A-like n=1 Tax=Sycon ciliatum TaxID=27933 RepID=UPI0031F6FBA5
MSGGGSRLDDPSKEPWPRWRRPSVSNRVVKTTRLEEANQMASYYRVDREPIGHGTFGVVHRAEHLVSSLVVAVKIVVKAEAGTRAVQMMENELTILRKVEHPHIVCLHEVFETHQQTMMVLEFCGGGDLEAVLAVRKRLANDEAKTVMTRLFSAVGYMHDNKMVHRDLKLENILLKVTEDDPWDIKVTDFGLSCLVEKGNNPEAIMQSYCGTPLYMAPEVLDSFRTYTKQCDVWSLGIIMFKLLSGSMPFKSTTAADLTKEIMKGNIDMSAAIWHKVNKEAKELLLQLLDVSPAKRTTAQEALQHPWITGRKGDYKLNVLQLMSEMSQGMSLEQKSKLDESSEEHSHAQSELQAQDPTKLSPQHGLKTVKSKSSATLGVPNGGASAAARPSSARKTSPSTSTSAHVPSYMRPTRASSTSAQASKLQLEHVAKKQSPSKKP